MDVGGVELEHALGPLGDLADTSRAAEVELRRKRLRSDQLRVLLVGEAKRGKSTLGNALLGRDILPTGVTPLTAVTTTVTDGHPERIHVIYTDGRTQEAAVEDLSQFVTENGNRHNHRESRGVTVVLDGAVEGLSSGSQTAALRPRASKLRDLVTLLSQEHDVNGSPTRRSEDVGSTRATG